MTGPGGGITSGALQTLASQDTLQSINSSGVNTTVDLPGFNQYIPGDPTHEYVLTSVQIVAEWAVTGTLNVSNYSTTSGSCSAYNCLIGGSAYAEMFATGPDSINFQATAPPPNGTGLQNGYAPNTGLVSNQNIPKGTLTTGPLPQGVCIYLGGTYNAGTCTNYVSPGSSSFNAPEGYSNPSNTNSGSVTTGLGSFETYNSSGGALDSSLPVGINVSSGTIGFNCHGSTGIACTATGDAGGAIEIVYNYDTVAIPEPATMALTGGALLALAAALRRKRSQA